MCQKPENASKNYYVYIVQVKFKVHSWKYLKTYFKHESLFINKLKHHLSYFYVAK